MHARLVLSAHRALIIESYEIHDDTYVHVCSIEVLSDYYNNSVLLKQCPTLRQGYKNASINKYNKYI